MSNSRRDLAKIIGKSIFYASIQAAIGSVEMSSRYSVVNFSKDQDTLQRGADALRSYMIVGLAWALGTILVMYSSYGYCGASFGFLANLLMMGWIYFSYKKAFKEAAKRYNLKEPKIF